MMKYDKLMWLERHGIFITNIWGTPSDESCVTWEADGGFTVTGKGITITKMYDNLYHNVKEELFNRCRWS